MKDKGKGKKKLSNRALSWMLAGVFALGLGIMMYPSIADYVNARNQTRVIQSYDSEVEKIPENDIEPLLAEARKFNENLADHPDLFYHPEDLKNYEDILNVSGDELMGYLTIHKIDVQLPIYHSTAEKYMQVGVGHLEGTSLPIGGENTHAVLTGHRGLPNSELLTHLDEMKKGDLFSVRVLNQEAWYEVDSIETVLPDEMDSLKITEGEDRCTLITCTPYGVNTHRLLVHGTRTYDIPTEEQVEAVKSEASRVDLMRMAPYLILLAVLLFLGLLWLIKRIRLKKKASKKSEEATVKAEEKDATSSAEDNNSSETDK